eukprot:1855374-Pyramimonas_sp.AAC.1
MPRRSQRRCPNGATRADSDSVLEGAPDAVDRGPHSNPGLDLNVVLRVVFVVFFVLLSLFSCTSLPQRAEKHSRSPTKQRLGQALVQPASVAVDGEWRCDEELSWTRSGLSQKNLFVESCRAASTGISVSLVSRQKCGEDSAVFRAARAR